MQRSFSELQMYLRIEDHRSLAKEMSERRGILREDIRLFEKVYGVHSEVVKVMRAQLASLDRLRSALDTALYSDFTKWTDEERGDLTFANLSLVYFGLPR